MNHPDYNSASSLKSFLEANGMAMQKKFGQNFMLNQNAREKIADLLDIHSGDEVWEIGPGLGCMTEEILKRGAKLTVFEIDRKFISFLHQFFEKEESAGQFRIVEGDVLKNWKKELEASSDAGNIKLFGNLPYNIAATFVADTIEAGCVFERCVFTVQKEVAERMASCAGSENYSAFSVLCQLSYNVRTDMILAPGNFWPKPNVASQVAVFMPLEKDRRVSVNTKNFVRLVHALFSSRRKTIANNIKPLLPFGVESESLFAPLGVTGKARAEELSVEQFIQLSQNLTSAIMSARKQD